MMRYFTNVGGGVCFRQGANAKQYCRAIFLASNLSRFKPQISSKQHTISTLLSVPGICQIRDIVRVLDGGGGGRKEACFPSM